MSALFDPMVAAARAAGDEIERIYGAGCATEWKPDGSPVTEADRAAEAKVKEETKATVRCLPSDDQPAEEGPPGR